MALGLDDYFAVSARQLADRGRVLLGKIPRGLSPHYGALVSTAETRLNKSIEDFTNFSSSDGRVPESVRQRQFRRMVGELDLIESIAMTALSRASDDDVILTQLVHDVCQEIHYPLWAPVVTATSQRYFAIYLDYRLMVMPLTEGHFLLHLPDIYHELAHPLLGSESRNNPSTQPFREAHAQTVSAAGKHFAEEMAVLRRGRSPYGLSDLLQQAELAWAHSWSIEFFCDVFATCMIGPAFAWSHLHLYFKRGDRAFSAPSGRPDSHPADDARMRVVLATLDRLGFLDEREQVARRWAKIVGIAEPSIPPEYGRCYPQELLEVCVDNTLEAARTAGCKLVGKTMSGEIRRLLNEAWQELWIRPSGYLDWEQRNVATLRSRFSRK